MRSTVYTVIQALLLLLLALLIARIEEGKFTLLRFAPLSPVATLPERGSAGITS